MGLFLLTLVVKRSGINSLNCAAFEPECATGVTLTPVDRQIRALPGRADWVFFEVPRQETPAWRDVQETQTLAMRLKDSLIANLDRLQGQQTLVVAAFGRKIALKFALFAVPAQT